MDNLHTESGSESDSELDSSVASYSSEDVKFVSSNKRNYRVLYEREREKANYYEDLYYSCSREMHNANLINATKIKDLKNRLDYAENKLSGLTLLSCHLCYEDSSNVMFFVPERCSHHICCVCYSKHITIRNKDGHPLSCPFCRQEDFVNVEKLKMGITMSEFKKHIHSRIEDENKVGLASP